MKNMIPLTKCPNCGQVISERTDQCPHCKTLLNGSEKDKTQRPAQTPLYFNDQNTKNCNMPPQHRYPHRSNHNNLLLVIILVFIIIGGLIGRIFYMSDKYSKRIAAMKANSFQQANSLAQIQLRKLYQDSVRKATSIEQAKYNGHKYVDLGLSVKWATCNVGASSPESFGNYYSWGEIKTKSDYSENNYQYIKSVTSPVSPAKYINIGNNISGTKYDVAHVKWGGKWRLPTEKEMTELCNNCLFSWINYNGVYGMKVIGPNGNHIFLPAASSFNGEKGIGDYWSGSATDDNDAVWTCSLAFYNLRAEISYDNLCTAGLTVRPVAE